MNSDTDIHLYPHISQGICETNTLKLQTQIANTLQIATPSPPNPTTSTFAWPRFPAGQLFCFFQPIFAIPVAQHRKSEQVHSELLNVFVPLGTPELHWLALIPYPTGSVMGLAHV